MEQRKMAAEINAAGANHLDPGESWISWGPFWPYENPPTPDRARIGLTYRMRSLTFSGPSVGTKRADSYNTRMPSPEQSNKDTLPVAVGKRIQDLREAKRIEPKDFAKAAGLTLSYLWRLEGGQQNVTLSTIARVALALGEPMTALLEGIDPDPAVLEAKRPYRRKVD